MVYNLVVATERGIFILDRMQTMWAGCHNSLWFYFIQEFNICGSQPEENIFTSRAPGRITCALFVLSKNREIDACRIQYFGKGLGSLLSARICCGRTADPPQNIRLRIFLNGWDVQSLCPFHSVCSRNIPRVGIT